MSDTRHYLLGEMTWPEIRKAAESGACVVLPAGSTEQHGHHLPVHTDSLIVDSVARAVVDTLAKDHPDNQFLLAPVLRIGASDHHRPFFALSLSEETYVKSVSEIGESIAQAGFSRLFILNGHGGNSAPLRIALSRLKRTAPSLLVAVGEYWSIAGKALTQLRTSKPGGAAHAGEIETSLMMLLDGDGPRSPPEASIPDMPDRYGVDLIEGGSVAVNWKWEEMSVDGHIGDPSVATEEKGRAFFDAAVEAVAQAVKAFSRMSRAQ